MDEPQIRALAVLIAAVLVGGFTWYHRRRAAAPRTLRSVGLEPGVYLFTSGTCEECQVARERLEEIALSPRPEEIRWDERPDLFQHLGVDAVPSTLVVGRDGSASLHRGVPVRRLQGRNP